jgi:hypothetical protein
MKQALLLLTILGLNTLQAQKSAYWQQRVDYKMTVDMDTDKYRYTGKQEISYTNNSPDTLRKVYYHLYPNAFQPGSEMDARLQTIKDPDARMVTKQKFGGEEVKVSRISQLKPDEIGYLNIFNFKQNGKPGHAVAKGTVLEVTLPKPILPKAKVVFTLDFEGQVPVQIRRSGRNNAEGIALSMSQWYPKLAEFDFEGWHADPYIAREFHGVWGDFDVKITIDKDYIIGGTGYLQNPQQIGFGYEKAGSKVTKNANAKKLTWHFKAPMVHDFTWAADKDYIHDKVQVPGGPMLHFLYKNNPKILDNWKNLQPLAVKVMQFFNKNVGPYPYEQYSVIQGGDGGMEYAMCTLLLGNGTLPGILGTTTHEMAHAWFQGIFASNESKHGWMDEGFASYIEDMALNSLAATPSDNPFEEAYDSYISMALTGKEQPQSTHADRFDENRLYSISSYRKGEVFMAQLEYLIGKENMSKTLKRFYHDFKFKHPTPNDMKRTAERVSGAHLDWYLTDWTQTTNTIDYSISNVDLGSSNPVVTLERIGRTPMPVELKAEYSDGSVEFFYIPLTMMHFTKPNEQTGQKRTVLKDWAWAFKSYVFELPATDRKLRKLTLDPERRTADVDKRNNVFESTQN